jgi:hypothetical protein
MGREDEGDRLAADRHRRARQQGDRPARYALHHPRRPLRAGLRQAKGEWVQLHWQSAPEGKQAKAKKVSKTKFTCPECGQNAWAKPEALLSCGDCYDDGEGDICLMIAAPAEEAEAASAIVAMVAAACTEGL